MSGSTTSSGLMSNFDELCSADTEDVNKLKELDNLLKCAICYEYFNTCVVTDCSHNFCSLCIRKYIQFKTECPVCFTELYDSQLRANRIVDNFISILPQLKDRLLRRIRTLKTLKPNTVYVSPSKSVNLTPKITPNSRKRRISMPKDDDDDAEEVATAVYIEPESNSPKASSSNAPTTPSFQNKIVIPPIFQSPVKKGPSTTPKNTSSAAVTVECPICSIEIPERNINMHLDVCLERQQNAQERRNAPKTNKRMHLPKLVLRLMSTAALRAKAREYGLNPHGDIETLKNRIQKYTVLYNAECDKVNPRPVHEIVRQLDKEEKILSQKLPKSFFSAPDNNTPKEELNAQYLKENKNCYDKLIENVRTRKSEESVSNVDAAADPSIQQSNALSSDPHQSRPSTSKEAPSAFYCKSTNEIDIEEIKIESVEDDKPDFKTNDDCEDNEDSDELFPISRNRVKRIGRLNFAESESSDEFVKSEIPFVDVNAKDDSSDPIFDALTDEDIDLATDNNPAISHAADSSPIIERRPRRKRKDEDDDGAVRKSLRKRRRINMAPTKSNQDREQFLQKKREAEKLRRNRIRNDPVLWKIQQKKEREKWKRKLEIGAGKLVSDMSVREHSLMKERWRKYSNKYYNKKKKSKDENYENLEEKCISCYSFSLSGYTNGSSMDHQCWRGEQLKILGSTSANGFETAGSGKYVTKKTKANKSMEKERRARKKKVVSTSAGQVVSTSAGQVVSRRTRIRKIIGIEEGGHKVPNVETRRLLCSFRKVACFSTLFLKFMNQPRNIFFKINT